MQGCGSDRYYRPDYLLRKDIVFVSFNYRLGIFGTITTYTVNFSFTGIIPLQQFEKMIFGTIV